MSTAAAEVESPARPALAGTSPTPIVERVHSVDAYRGLVMFLMMAEVLHLSRVSRALPENSFWKFLAWHQTHVEWVGCTLHDLIQPSFTFLVGVALPYSIANRMAKGHDFAQMFRHALGRSLILVWLGIFLRSVGREQTNFTFEDTLTQIGLGYSFAFLLAFVRVRALWIALGTLLIGYWAAWAIYPAPGANFNWQAVGVPSDWPHHLNGFAAHWDKNSNLGHAFDVWFLNLFPREKPFLYNGGGYLTLSFVPTLGTMLFGVLAGQCLRSERTFQGKLVTLGMAGVLCLLVGTLLHLLGICPLVKRIWTPTWTIFSAGWCFLILAAFYWVMDVKKHRGWAFPLLVIGMNSIAAYSMAHLFEGFILNSFQTHLGKNFAEILGPAYAPLISGSAVLLVFWAILYWMYRRKLYLKV